MNNFIKLSNFGNENLDRGFSYAAMQYDEDLFELRQQVVDLLDRGMSIVDIKQILELDDAILSELNIDLDFM